MKNRLIIALALLALAPVAAPAAPAAAQEWQVARERFTFVGTRLTIRVEPGPAGNLRIMRGAPGTVRVASRAGQGFTAAGLTDSDELTLTAMGDGPVDYLVSVPENVRVQVRLPGSTFGEAMSGRTRSRSFQWDEHRGETHGLSDAPAPEWLPPLDGDGPQYTTFVRDLAPAVVSVPDLSHVRSLTVRLQPGPFRTLTSRPFAMTEGDSELLEIRPAAPPVDLVLAVPTGTARFRLVAGGLTVLELHDGAVTGVCAPVTDQRLSDGRRWLTFTPMDGALRCTDPMAPRHEG